MSAILRVTGADLRYLSSQLNVLADELRSAPFVHVGGMPHCGSGLVATAGAAANEHFALRALLLESELRDLGAMAVHVDLVMGEQDAELSTSAGGGW